MQTQPLKVYLTEISPHSQAILEFFIASSGKNTFTLAKSAEEADAYIVDYDHPGSRERWQSVSAKSAKPSIALAINDPGDKSVHWVSKPITSQALIQTAKTIINDAVSLDRHEGNGMQKKSAERNKPPTLPRISPGQSPFRKETRIEAPRPQPNAFTNSESAPIIAKRETALDIAAAVLDEPASTAKKATSLAEKAAQAKKQPAPQASVKSDETESLQELRRRQLLCGKRGDVNLCRLKPSDEICYNSVSFFLGTLIAGLRLGRQTRQIVQIKYEPYQFYICYEDFRIFSAISPSSDEFAELCHIRVKPGQVNLHILNSEESGKIREKLVTDSEYTYDLESYIWTSSLLTSRGRVPASPDCEQAHLLKFWPNLTRVEPIPYAMKIAARWQRKPYRVSELAKAMDIPQRYVIAFYNGAIGLSLFETDMTKIEEKIQTQPRKRSGFLSRLFGRLTRNEASSQ